MQTSPARSRLGARILVLAAAGCGGLTSNTELIPGVYTLVSVNGQPLPFLLEFLDADNKLELEAGNVSIVDDGNFVDATTFRITQNGVVSTQTDVDSGEWSLDRGTVTFTLTGGGGSYTMRVNAGSTQLSQAAGSLVLLYQRE